MPHDASPASAPAQAPAQDCSSHDHDHDHDHEHRHGHHHHGPHAHAHSGGRAFAISLTLNGLYAFAEIAYGVRGHSLALVADAVHNLGDMLALGAAWGANWLTSRPPTRRYTYGYGSSSILTALANTMLLLLITGGIAWQSLLRLRGPAPASGATILLVALVGVAINGGTAMLFFRERGSDLNKRAAFQHLLADTGITAGVVVAGALTLVTGWLWLDPLASLCISVAIIGASWSLLRDIVRLAMGAIPAGIEREAVLDFLRRLPGVRDVHDLHIWALSTTSTALTAHLVRPQERGTDDAFLDHVSDELGRRFRIRHATIQIEAGDAGHPCHTDCGLGPGVSENGGTRRSGESDE